MERRLLGNSDLAISPIGLGAWAIGGGDWCLGWGPQTDDDSIATIRRAIACGWNWIDTAAVYGLGRSETIIARALRGLARDRRPYVFTTAGFVWDDLGNVSRDLSARSIREQAEASLRRLGVDVIDLYQVDPGAADACRLPSRGGSIEEAWEAMAALRCEGKVRHLAVTSAAPRVLSALERIAPVTSVQAPYSLLQRDIEHDLLPYCAERRLAVLAASPMASGLLTGTLTPARMRSLPCNDWRRRSPSFGSDLLARAERVVDRLREVGERNGLAPGAMAIAWTLSQPAITAAIAGARRPAQVVEIAAAATSRPGDEDLADVARVLAYTGAHPHQPASPG